MKDDQLSGERQRPPLREPVTDYGPVITDPDEVVALLRSQDLSLMSVLEREEFEARRELSRAVWHEEFVGRMSVEERIEMVEMLDSTRKRRRR